VLLAGLAAALPVIVATIRAAANGWVPLGDDAIIVVRSYDVLSSHPPLLGPYSTSSQLIGHPVLSPGAGSDLRVARHARLVRRVGALGGHAAVHAPALPGVVAGVW
jgi:hypothetical protein